MSYGKYIYELTKKEMGFYVDVGSHDGITGNQTKFLEDIGWSGICIEGNIRVFPILQKNRKCICHNDIIYKDNSEYDWCSLTAQYSGSAIKENLPPAHIEQNLSRYGLSIIKFRTTHLEQALDLYQVPQYIDFLKIDTEGSDLAIIQSLSFTKYMYNFILVENGWCNNKTMIEFLNQKNYTNITNNDPHNLLFRKNSNG